MKNGFDEPGKRRIKGMLLMALAGIYITFANALVQFIRIKMKAPLPPLSFFLVRSAFTAAGSFLFLLVAKINPFPNNRAVIFLLVSAVACAFGVLFVFEALDKIPVGDVTVLFFTSPIMTSALGLIFLKQKCSVVDAFCIVFNFAGIIVMTQPSFLFEKQEPSSQEMCRFLVEHSKVLNIPGTRHYMIGAIYSLLGSLCFAVFYILTQHCSKNTDVMLTLFYVGIVGTLMAISISIASKKFISFSNNWKIWMLLFFVGLLSFVHMLFVAEALLLEDAGPCVVIRNADSIYAFILQYFLMKVTPGVNTLIGGVIVIVSTTALAVYRYVSAKNRTEDLNSISE